MSAEQLATRPLHRDRSTRLVVVGVFQILIGCVCVLGAVVIAAARFLPATAHAQRGPAPTVVPVVAVYLVLAVVFVCLGIGMIAARRWAWTLTVVTSCMWLVFGAIAFVSVVFIVGPRTSAYTAEQGKMPAQMLGEVRLLTGIFLGFFYIGLPMLLLLLSREQSVRATCVAQDPRIPWTDRCPMPVLALSLFLASSILSFWSLAAYRFVVPVFGIFLSGIAGAIVVAAITILLAYLAWDTYRMKVIAWWGALLFGIGGAVNSAVTFARADLAEMHKLQGFSADRVEMFRKMGLLELMPRWGLWGALTGGAAWILYLLAVRRYFVKSGGFSAPEGRSTT